jgi:hypothetical protein
MENDSANPSSLGQEQQLYSCPVLVAPPCNLNPSPVSKTNFNSPQKKENHNN